MNEDNKTEFYTEFYDVRERICPRCHKPVDPFDRNATRNAETRQWQHKDCRRTPRRTPY